MIDSVINVERLSASLSRYSLSLVRSKAAAEDLAQESWSRALPALRENGGHANPEALLLRVARNAWIDGLRRDARKAKLIMETPPEEAATERPLLALELAPVFAALNAFLPKLQRTVFLLRDVLGYSIRETADRLGTTEGAVKAAHARARRSLAFVRASLVREDGPGLPADADERIEAHLMAEAYAKGDIGTLVALANGEARMQARQLPVQGAASRAMRGDRTQAPEAMPPARALLLAA
ncbi:RNA polymerase sigma factor [Cohnella rhizosphaerae]|uniref:RNA polymerase sigma factor n=1 Tax=Cohnella rhizosphaerae TaxID=1457232 RepID=A0A9X4KWK8_9BACL|nr:RNA polymerase sigma factor [Cohnella rhizosphaerae]MDG0812599.1 RNA polymerase sigma factor [Cohnella rhizosphaerae]